MKQVWQCDKCGRVWPNPTLAEGCEKRHFPVSKVEALDYCQGVDSAAFPKRVRVVVKLPKDKAVFDYDYAVYTLDHIGPKGV